MDYFFSRGTLNVCFYCVNTTVIQTHRLCPLIIQEKSQDENARLMRIIIWDMC